MNMSIFQPKDAPIASFGEEGGRKEEVETVVGASMKVEGDLVSEGNVVIQGTVTGSVRTEKNLRIEEGARINANVAAEHALVSGEVKGNVKTAGTLELTPSARVYGDVEAKTLIVAGGAVLHGRCIMAEEEARVTAKSGVKNKKSEIGKIAVGEGIEAPTMA